MCETRRPGFDTEKTPAPQIPGAAENFHLDAEKAAGLIARDPFDELFRYHPPTPQQLPKYAAINQAAKNFAEVIRSNCPIYSRQFERAIDAIMEARMLANASVALEGKF